MGKQNKKADENQEPVVDADNNTGGTEPEPEKDLESVTDIDKVSSAVKFAETELDLSDRKEYKIILLKNLPPLKVDDEKIVSGNVAKALIKKGLAKLK